MDAHIAACDQCAAAIASLLVDAATVRGWLQRAAFEEALPDAGPPGYADAGCRRPTSTSMPMPLRGPRCSRASLPRLPGLRTRRTPTAHGQTPAAHGSARVAAPRRGHHRRCRCARRGHTHTPRRRHCGHPGDGRRRACRTAAFTGPGAEAAGPRRSARRSSGSCRRPASSPSASKPHRRWVAAHPVRAGGQEAVLRLSDGSASAPSLPQLAFRSTTRQATSAAIRSTCPPPSPA
jgi:hypothetical protein